MNQLNIEINELQNDYLGLVDVSDDEIIRSLAVDSRKVRPGDWFICLKGEKFDGHDFIDQAFSAGASGVIFEGDRKVKRGINVSDTTIFLGRLAAIHRKIINPVVIAITGSNGKTSTKELTAYLLKSIFRDDVCYSSGNYNNHFGLPFTMLSLKSNHRFLVAELGTNHPGEISYLSGLCSPDYSIITSVSMGHIGNFGSRINILEEKSDIMTGMKYSGKLFLPPDLAMEDIIINKSKKYKIEIKTGDPAIQVKKFNDDSFEFFWQDGTYILPLVGEHQFENLKLVISLLEEIFSNADDLSSALNLLRNFKPVKGRLQKVPNGNFNLWDDSYNANPGSFVKAIDFIAGIHGQSRMFGAFGMMGELGDLAIKAHEELGEYAARTGFAGVFFSSPDETLREAFRHGWLQYASTDQLITTTIQDDDIKAGYEFLSRKMFKGDHLLVKGSRSTRMERMLDFFQGRST